MSSLTVSPHNAARARLVHGEGVDLVLRDGLEEIRACLTPEQRAELIDALLAGFGAAAVLVVTRRQRKEAADAD